MKGKNNIKTATIPYIIIEFYIVYTLYGVYLTFLSNTFLFYAHFYSCVKLSHAIACRMADSLNGIYTMLKPTTEAQQHFRLRID